MAISRTIHRVTRSWRRLTPRDLVLAAILPVLSIALTFLLWEVLLFEVQPRPAVMERLEVARAVTAGVLIALSVVWLLLRIERRSSRALERELAGRKPSNQQASSPPPGASSVDLTLAEERERRRIAIGLHDEIGQSLALAKMRLRQIESSTEDRIPSARLGEVRDVLDRTIQTCRTLTFDLSSPVLYELGLEAALQSLGQQLEESSGIRFRFRSDGRSMPVPEDLAIILYRSARELLRNIARHSRARNAWMSFVVASGAVRLEIADDGVGIHAAAPHLPGRNGGFGIFSIAEQLRDVGGSLEVSSATTTGTRIVITAPLGGPGDLGTSETSAVTAEGR